MFGRRRSGFVPGRATLWWFCTAVAIGLIGWSKAINLLLILGFVLLGLLLCQGVAARGMARRIRLVPESGAAVWAGQASPVVFRVTNPSPDHATFRVVGPRGLAWLCVQLPAGESWLGTGHLVIRERGRHRPGRFGIESAYPFGVLKYRRECCDVPAIDVLPALGTVNERLFHHWLRFSGQVESRELRATTRRWNADGDVRGIRPYRTGDNPKDVHWKSTARRGTLYVREYDSTPPKELVILVEAYAPPDTDAYAPLEAALSLAATLAWEWSRWDGNSTARVIVFGKDVSAMKVAPGNPGSLRELAGAAGSPEVVGQPWLGHGRILRGGHRVFVTSREGSRLPGELGATGFPVLVAGSGPVWYRPPSSLAPESN
jgi:uncharacterized protein (DUF58 family)